MSSTSYKYFDKQRFKKTYPIRRRRPITAVISDKGITLESAGIVFTEASGITQKTYNFKEPYNSAPTVTYGVHSTNGDMVVVRISAITTSGVTIELSAPFDGTVDIQVLEIV